MISTSEKFVIELLSKDAFLMVNKSLLRALEDCDEAIVLSELVSAYRTFRDTSIDGWFFQTVNYLEQDLGISYYRQRKAIKSLVEKQLVRTKRIGMPALRYFKLDMGNIEALLLDQQPTPLPEVKSKKDFYIGLQDAITYEEFKAAAGNIKEELVQVMWVWSRAHRAYVHTPFKWNSKEFGIIKNWALSLKRPIDWSRLNRVCKAYCRESNSITLFGLIEYERSVPEVELGCRVCDFYEYKKESL